MVPAIQPGKLWLNKTKCSLKEKNNSLNFQDRKRALGLENMMNMFFHYMYVTPRGEKGIFLPFMIYQVNTPVSIFWCGIIQCKTF